MKKEDLIVYQKIMKSAVLKEEKKAFASLFKRPIWYSSPDIPDRKSLKKHLSSMGKLSIKIPRKESECITCMLKNIRRARRTKSTQKFKCHNQVYAFVLPLIQGNKIYGHLSLCNADVPIPDNFLRMFKLSVDNIIKEIQKELELNKLYETIRPRAIALSTIHTIHRLISSTLDLDELLPRIARLSVQVMRAYRCSIKLLDKKKKGLIPKTTVDIRKNKKIRLTKLPVGKGIPGKAAKLCKTIRGKAYISVPLIDEDMIGIITVYDKVNQKPFTQFDEEILTTLAEQAVIAIKNAQLYKEQQEIIVGSIKSLAMILNTRAQHVYHPSELLVRLTVEVGREMGMNVEDLRSLEVASLLHDAGQVSVPDEILTKPTKLTGEEYALVKEHPTKSVKILEPLKALKPVVPIILHHHEKYDGSGYPKGLKGDNIPLGARIMAVTGAFEAMVVLRPYRKKVRSIEEAVEEIKKQAGIQFDPAVINVFTKVLNKPEIKKLLKEVSYGA